MTVKAGNSLLTLFYLQNLIKLIIIEIMSDDSLIVLCDIKVITQEIIYFRFVFIEILSRLNILITYLPLNFEQIETFFEEIYAKIFFLFLVYNCIL